MRRTVVEALVLCLVALVPAVGSALYHPGRPPWDPHVLDDGEVDVATALAWDAVLWVDARSTTDYEAGHIPNAVLLNEDDWDSLLPAFLGRWGPDLKIVVYCSSLRCRASTAVADRLRNEVGIASVYVLKGGWEAWPSADKSLGRSVLFLLRVAVGGLFLYAGSIKILDPAGFLLDIQGYRLLPYRAEVVVAFYLPWLEVVCGLAVLGAVWGYRGALMTVALLATVFLGALVSAAWRGLDVSCGCFGSGAGHTGIGWPVTRDIVLLVAIGVVWAMDERCCHRLR